MKIEKIMKQCQTCKGSKFLPDHIVRQLVHPPKEGKKVKCSNCRGKGFVFVKK